MKKIHHKLHIHPTLWMFIIISFMTGTFIQLFIIISIVTIHELGHYFAAKYFQWRIDGIMLWAFGGVMKTDEHPTRPLKEELIVTLCGPMQHIFIFFLTFLIEKADLLPTIIVSQINYYNMIILFFNLIPIYPLDGAKLYLALVSFLLPFRRAYRFTLVSSLTVAFIIIGMQIFLFPFTLTALILIAFLVVEIVKYWRNEYFLFIRFLLYRFHHRPKFKRKRLIYATKQNRLIDIFNDFYRYYDHRIHIPNHYSIPEVKALELYFQERRYSDTIEQLAKEL